MSTVLEIEMDTPQAQQFVAFARTLPFATILIEARKKSFEEAAAECGAVTVDAFFDELKNRVKERYRNARG